MKLLVSSVFAVAVSFISINASASTTLCGQFGCPQGAPSSNQTVSHGIFKLSNNRSTKFADWVAYTIKKSYINGPSRSRYWKADPKIASSYTLEPDDYKDAHAQLSTDRGHQAPLASFSNTSSWSATNYLSNITPQKSDLNQGPWVRLESAVRNFVNTGKRVYVVTGPLYESWIGSLPGADEQHRIPSGYFKVVSTISSSGWVETSAFIMPQASSRHANYCGYEVTIDQVELRTGLDIMPGMPAYKERAVESRTGGLRSELGC